MLCVEGSRRSIKTVGQRRRSVRGPREGIEHENGRGGRRFAKERHADQQADAACPLVPLLHLGERLDGAPQQVLRASVPAALLSAGIPKLGHDPAEHHRHMGGRVQDQGIDDGAV